MIEIQTSVFTLGHKWDFNSKTDDIFPDLLTINTLNFEDYKSSMLNILPHDNNF